jgi:Rifampin ADP-ribosyl transferase
MTAHDAMNKTQFFHGTRADLKPGDLIEPGHGKNWDASHSTKVYFGDRDVANRFATGDHFSPGEKPGQPKVYPVEPTGKHWKNANVEGNARASRSPLRVTGPAEPWHMGGNHLGGSSWPTWFSGSGHTKTNLDLDAK